MKIKLNENFSQNLIIETEIYLLYIVSVGLTKVM